MTDQLFERDYTVFDIPALKKPHPKAEKKKPSGSGILAEKSLLHVIMLVKEEAEEEKDADLSKLRSVK